MSLQSMMSGADCAVAVNPLHQVLKHSEADRVSQQDRMAGPSTSRLQYMPSTSVAQANPADLQMARQFFDGTAGGMLQSPIHHGIQARPSMPMISSVEVERLQSTPLPPGWAEMSTNSMSADWSMEFKHAPLSTVSSPQAQNASQSYNTSMYRSQFTPNYGYGTSPYAQMQTLPRTGDVKGKGKLSEADFAAAFASFDQEQQRIVEVDDDLGDLEKAFARQTLGDGESKMDDEMLMRRMSRITEDMGTELEDMARWESDGNQLRAQEREDLDFAGDIEEYYKRMAAMEDIVDMDGMMKFDDDGIPQLGEYVFEKNNPFINHSSPLAQAKAILEANGSLTEAALLLEAAIQKSDWGVGGYEAWILLGETWSMDEREEAAMKALANGVKIANQAGEKGVGMISLAISYTNENYDKASYSTLLAWLKAKYPYVTGGEDAMKSTSSTGGMMASWALRDQATDAFLKIAREQHAHGLLDPDVQIGLGVLLYTGGDFERAKDCFESALITRPRDYLLWNRFGSCLSNGNKPEEALGAYREALNIRPTYTRAIYNVGVACLNIGTYQEAAEHLLSGLALQASAGGTTSEQLWTTLRRCFMAMNRMDLSHKAEPGTDPNIFKSEGFEF